ncbi:hypothetical protein [Hafnia paralvei]|uniref:hypothetical protein n=1 Tax=Hafnia paralvei TaxID=546367 RepID=UPI000BB55F0E|nr:hypothetical protein [Hafnia paralvei]PNK66798.1 hypothetical protein A6J69_007015 [Hafnia paralvei]
MAYILLHAKINAKLLMKIQFLLLISFQIILIVSLLLFRKYPLIHIAFTTLAVISVMPLAYFIGTFSQRLNSNLCYSYMIAELATTSTVAIQSSSSATQQKYIDGLKSIPNYGYESNCNDMTAAVKRLSQSVKDAK